MAYREVDEGILEDYESADNVVVSLQPDVGAR